MATETIEERLAAVESKLDRLQTQLSERLRQTSSRERGGWPAIVGTFENDPLYEEAMRLGREWRESQRADEPPSATPPN